MDTAGMGENTNTPAGDSSGEQNTGMPDSENSGGMPESTAVSGGQSSGENTAGEEQSSVENTAATAIADESGRLREVSVQTERNLHQMPSQAET